MSISKERLEELYNAETAEMQKVFRSESPKKTNDGYTMPYGLWEHESRDLTRRQARINLLNDLMAEATSNIPSETTRQQP